MHCFGFWWGLTDGYQNALTRKNVRLRDGKCLASGEEVPGRDRGPNYTGFQVGHIYPVKGVNNVSEGFSNTGHVSLKKNAAGLDGSSFGRSKRSSKYRKEGG
jgi:hypothetical protein